MVEVAFLNWKWSSLLRSYTRSFQFLVNSLGRIASHSILCQQSFWKNSWLSPMQEFPKDRRTLQSLRRHFLLGCRRLASLANSVRSKISRSLVEFHATLKILHSPAFKVGVIPSVASAYDSSVSVCEHCCVLSLYLICCCSSTEFEAYTLSCWCVSTA